MPVTAQSEWPLSRLLAIALLPFSGKKPLYRFPELTTDPQQYFRPNFLFATLYIRKVPLAYPNPLRKFFLGHVKASEFPNPSTDTLPVERASLPPDNWP